MREKLVEGIADLRDESDRDGVRVVIELKRDAEPDIVLNQLYRHTALQTSFGVNMLALNGGRPEQMTLRDILVAFIAFREEVITRRTIYLLGKARERAHILLGLLVAVANHRRDHRADPRRARPGDGARRADRPRAGRPAMSAPLVALVGERGRAVAADGTYQLSDEQARAILDLRLQRLTGLERDKIAEETPRSWSPRSPAISKSCARATRLIEVLRGELLAIKEQFATPRRTDDRGCRVRDRYRGADPARGHGRDGQPRRLHQARAAVDLPRAAARRARPRRHGDARGGFRQRGLRRLDPRAGAVLHLVGPGLQAQGLSPAGRHAAGARQGDGQPAAQPGAGRDDLDRDAAARGRGKLGRLHCHVRHRQGLCPAQRAVRFRQRPRQRQDRDEVRGRGRRRPPDRGRDLHRRRRRPARHAQRPAIRFPVDDVRVFTGRSSVGVRGIRLLGDDTVISMSILRHEEVAPEMRYAYLSLAAERRRQNGDEEARRTAELPPEPEDDEAEPAGRGCDLRGAIRRSRRSARNSC